MVDETEEERKARAALSFVAAWVEKIVVFLVFVTLIVVMVALASSNGG